MTVEMFYLNSTLNFEIPPVLVLQLEVYYKVDRRLTDLTAQQKGTTDRWYSNKTSLVVITTHRPHYITRIIKIIIYCLPQLKMCRYHETSNTINLPSKTVPLKQYLFPFWKEFRLTTLVTG